MPAGDRDGRRRRVARDLADHHQHDDDDEHDDDEHDHPTEGLSHPKG